MGEQIRDFIITILGIDGDIGQSLKDTFINVVLPQFIATLILLFVIRFFFWNKVTALLDARKEHVRKQVSEAESLKVGAEKLEQEHNELMATAKEEARRIVEEARSQANLVKEDIIQKAKDEADHRIQRAEDEIAAEVERARKDLQVDVVNLALLAAEQIIDKEIDNRKHKELITEFIEGLGE